MGWASSYKEQTRGGGFTKTLSPVDGFPAGCACLTEDVSFVPDAFHSGSRLEKVPKVVLTSESPREVLTLGQVICHAPRDINGEDDCLVNLSGRQLLNQLNHVRDRGRNLVDTCAIMTASVSAMIAPEKERDPPGLGSLNVV